MKREYIINLSLLLIVSLYLVSTIIILINPVDAGIARIIIWILSGAYIIKQVILLIKDKKEEINNERIQTKI